MARALVGYVGSATDHNLALEVARLRGRVRELEAELAEVHAERRVTLDLELHEFTENSQHVLA
jgi:hypothetical protein